MTKRARRLLWLLVPGAIAIAAERESLPPLVVIDHDIIYYKGTADPDFGTIVKTLENGDLLFRKDGGKGTIQVAKDSIERYTQRQSAQEVIERRGKILLAEKGKLSANDEFQLQDTIRFGRSHNAGDGALTLALAANALHPEDAQIGEPLLEMLKEKRRNGDIELVAKGLLLANPNFDPAYEALAGVLQASGNRRDELTKLCQEWITHHSTQATPNRILAEVAEEDDDLRGAQEAFRKLYQVHHDWAGAVGYARCCIKLGDDVNALKAAQDLIDNKEHVDEAKALAGAAQLALGKPEEAQTLLEQAVAGTLPGEVASWVAYDLALVSYKSGNVQRARELWAKADQPENQLALAILDHKPFAAPDHLTDRRLRAVAQEHNACLLLEARKPQQALAGIDPKTSERHRFLADVADVLRTNGSDSSLRALAATPGVESLRWQAYGLLLARNYRQAEKVIDQLPAADGYGFVYRVYAAEAQQQKARAKDIYRNNVAAAVDPPHDYALALHFEYEVAEDEGIDEPFDWPEGDLLATGWDLSAHETNIRIHAAKGQLVLEGTQTASEDPISRAWTKAPAERLRNVRVEFDLSGANGAVVGIELLDDKQANGVAYAALGGARLGWRSLSKGVWGAWQDLPNQVQGTKLSLAMEFNSGRVSALSAESPNERLPLGEALLPTTGFLCVSIFGTADPGLTWRAGADAMHVQFRPKPSAHR